MEAFVICANLHLKQVQPKVLLHNSCRVFCEVQYSAVMLPQTMVHAPMAHLAADKHQSTAAAIQQFSNPAAYPASDMMPSHHPPAAMHISNPAERYSSSKPCTVLHVITQCLMRTC